MALRVLLADESSTIKKAIQMALSEYGVEVKSVPSGLDVLAVTHTFQPDVILADVLLTKKNGYEVCQELKSDPATKAIPVILMWSSFMQIDQNQARTVRADGMLEKPFDTDGLRAVIEKLVPKIKNFPLQGLLNHPPLPDFAESETFVRQRTQFNPAPTTANPNQNKPAATPGQPAAPSKPVIEDVEEDFVFNPTTNSPQEQSSSDSQDEWSASTPGQFVIETESFGDFEEVTVVNNSQTTPDLQRRIKEQVHSYLQDSPLAQRKASDTPSFSKGMSQFDEQILKEEIKQLAERICWQIIPEITEKVVREELNKLLQGLEKHT